MTGSGIARRIFFPGVAPYLREKALQLPLPEKVKTTLAVAVTGLIWSRYSMVVVPKNWNLFTVNLAMAVTGLIQLCRVTLYKMQQAKQQ